MNASVDKLSHDVQLQHCSFEAGFAHEFDLKIIKGALYFCVGLAVFQGNCKESVVVVPFGINFIGMLATHAVDGSESRSHACRNGEFDGNPSRVKVAIAKRFPLNISGRFKHECG